MKFSVEKFRKNAPKGVQKQLADHLDVLEGKEVVFDGELGEVKQYLKNGV